MSHPNDIEPRYPCPFAGEDDPTAERAGEDRKTELDDFSLRTDKEALDGLLEAFVDYLGSAEDAEFNVCSAIVRALIYADRMDNTACAASIKGLFARVKNHAAQQAEKARAAEIERERQDDMAPA
jgi:hypothetical protein